MGCDYTQSRNALSTEKSRVVIAPTRENICAVIVTYHPDRELPQRVERIASQVQHVVIVDNHSDPSTVAMLKALSPRLNLRLFLNEENLGIATALNQGMAEASRLGASWALLLDQDTVPFESMVSVFGQVYEEYPEKETLAVIGSNFLEVSAPGGRPALTVAAGATWAEQVTVITSGSLLSIPLFHVVGPFRDELFIDEVDTEYCLRARTLGFTTVVSREPLMAHSVGIATSRRFLWRTVRPSNHSAFRWYYMIRNPIVLTREYWRAEPRWVTTNLYIRLKLMVKALLYESDRRAKLQRMLLGGWHGLRGRLGRDGRHRNGRHHDGSA